MWVRIGNHFYPSTKKQPPKFFYLAVVNILFCFVSFLEFLKLSFLLQFFMQLLARSTFLGITFGGVGGWSEAK